MSDLNVEEIKEETHRWEIVQLDNNLFIQGYIESTEIDFKLRGYTSGSDPSYFDTPADIAPGTKNTWAAVGVSAFVDADGVILVIDSQDGGKRNTESERVEAASRVPPVMKDWRSIVTPCTWRASTS